MAWPGGPVSEKMPYRSEPMNQIAGLMIGIVMDLGILARQQRAMAPA